MKIHKFTIDLYVKCIFIGNDKNCYHESVRTLRKDIDGEKV